MTLRDISDALSKCNVLHLATEYHVMTNNPVIAWECLRGTTKLVSVQDCELGDSVHRVLTEILSNVYSVSKRDAEELIQKVKDDGRR